MHKKLYQASETIERAKVRSRAIGRKLKDVEGLPAGETASLLSMKVVQEDEEALEGEGPTDESQP